MASDEPIEVGTEIQLPTARKGYDRAATDELVGQLRSNLAAALAQRNQAQTRVVELEQQLTDNEERERRSPRRSWSHRGSAPKASARPRS